MEIDYKANFLALIIGGASAFGFTHQFVKPIWVEQKENEIYNLEKAVKQSKSEKEDEIHKFEKSIVKLKKEIAELKSKNDNIKAEIKQASIKIRDLKKRNRELWLRDIVSAANIYPKGFREITIGDKILKVEETHQDDEINKYSKYYSVKISEDNDSFFSNITYYYENSKIYKIMFMLDYMTQGIDEAESGFTPLAYRIFSNTIKSVIPSTHMIIVEEEITPKEPSYQITNNTFSSYGELDSISYTIAGNEKSIESIKNYFSKKMQSNKVPESD